MMEENERGGGSGGMGGGDVDESGMEGDMAAVVPWESARCVRWGCDYAALAENAKGFMCCTKCGSSYGRRG